MDFYSRLLKQKKFLQPALIVLFCFLIYIPSLKNGFIWDDDANLYNNPYLRTTQGLKAVWLSNELYQYYPVHFTFFWIGHRFWGLNPSGYHAVNLFLHILNALLFFWIAAKFYRRLAFIAALLFAIHPIQVETVAWITEQKNLLSMFFFLAAVLAYLRFDRSGRIRFYLLAVAMFVCALLSKPVAIYFIFFPVLYKYWQEGKISWRQIRLSAVFVAAGFLIVARDLYLEYYHVGARGEAFVLTFAQRLALSGRIAVFYINKLLFPFHFMFFYPRWEVDAGAWQQWLYLFAVIAALAALAIYRKKIGRGAFVLFAFYLISIFPVLGFFNVYGMKFSYVADHFSYLSTPALLLLFCAGAAFFLDKLKVKFPFLRSLFYRSLGWGLFAAAVIYLCVESAALTSNYRNENVLWENLIKKNPKAWVAYNNLGVAYADAGKTREAIVLYNKAIEVNPDYVDAYSNLVTVYAAAGETREVTAICGKAAGLKLPMERLYYALGNTYDSHGRKKEALEAYQQAIRIAPGYVDAMNNLASVYADLGEVDKAIELWEKAVRIAPDFATARFNLAVFYFQRKKYDLAIKHCDRLVRSGYRIDPGFLKMLEPYRK